MANELGRSTSPYLRQHAGNPVEWREWSERAFAEARERDVPVFLSVGYSACHWCHVMAHESFEDADTAAYLSEHFVSVKVDREERPDVDAIYMAATVAMTGQGGWPMSVFLTPAGEPFFCGTYFPREARGGMASFRQVLEAITDAWQNRREQLDGIGKRVVSQLGSQQGGGSADFDLERAVELLKTDFDPVDGGFGRAPKFPPSMVLDFLLRHHRRTGDEDALAMVAQTCSRMARGGMYDQLAGGFARYSVDGQWVVPHFEKMLYDNALLLDVYTHWWTVSGEPLARRIALETADFLLAELRTAEGGFASALDADTEGEEGKYYVWTPEQLRAVLSADDAAWVISLCDVTGTFEHGSSVLQLSEDPSDEVRWSRVRADLGRARDLRTYPGRDDKVVAAWNGLAITALTRAGVVLERPEYVEGALGAARLIRDVHLDGSRLYRTSRDGVRGSADGVLEDYAAFAQGCLTLLGATGDVEWFRTAEALLDRVLDQFVADGTYYDTAADAEQLIWRPQDPTDNATASGVSLTAEALTTLTSLTGSARYEAAAHQALTASADIANRAPRFAGRALAVAETTATGPLEIAILTSTTPAPTTNPASQTSTPSTPSAAAPASTSTPATPSAAAPASTSTPATPSAAPASAASAAAPASAVPVPAAAGVAGFAGPAFPAGLGGVAGELVRVAFGNAPWGTVIVAGAPDLGVPLMDGRGLVGGQPAAYVCQKFTCKLPVTLPEDLREQLRPAH
ncbi:thioredoxin domain-containing protein [Kribbella sp. NPDC004536]|uniref:thioredoxin domain-containing protein n=1 Tax=Kribbella sp. NPDC004536 TaxID=3364106 RepID=UPI003679901C